MTTALPHNGDPNELARRFRALTQRLKESSMPDKHPAADLQALPGVMASATREINDEAGTLAERFRKAIDKKNAQIARGNANAEKLEKSLAEIEAFNDRMESVVGGNGDPAPVAVNG